MKDTKAQMVIRLPLDIKAWLESEADKNFSSKNSEIVRAIRERMDHLQPLSPAAAVPGLPPP